MSYQGVVSRCGWRDLFFGIFASFISTLNYSGWSASVALSWNPSPDNTVVAYKIYYGTESANYPNSISVGNVTNTTLTGLSNGTTYYFAAVAIDDLGSESLLSNEAFATPPWPANQTPTLNAPANVTLNEDASAQTVTLTGISSGSSNEVQNLTVTASSSNPSLIPQPAVSYATPNATGSLTFTPVANAFGAATITVTVNDGGASNNIVTRTFTVTVNPVNDTPTLNALSAVSINQNTGLQTVSLTGISSGAANENQTLTVTASSSNPGLIPNPAVSYTSPNATGSLSFTPTAGTTGSATITVNVTDGGSSNNIVTRSFTATVNRLPVISALTNRTIVMNTSTPAIPFTISDPETAAGNLTVTATSSDPALVPAENLVLAGSAGNRTLVITPGADATGVTDITIRVSDGTGNTSQTFQLTVRPLPTAPANLRIAQVLP